jgi:hypothetical protein
MKTADIHIEIVVDGHTFDRKNFEGHGEDEREAYIHATGEVLAYLFDERALLVAKG